MRKDSRPRFFLWPSASTRRALIRSGLREKVVPLEFRGQSAVLLSDERQAIERMSLFLYTHKPDS
jgi:hypothetical protein